MKKPRAVIIVVAVAFVALLAWPAVGQADTVDLVSVASEGTQGNSDSRDCSISGDGSAVAFSSDATNLVAVDANGSTYDVFLRDLETGTTALVSVSSDEEQGNSHSDAPSINADGSIVAFMSFATNLVAGTGDESYSNIYVRYLLTGITELVSETYDGDPVDGGCWSPSISADGSTVAFTSEATNLLLAADGNLGDPDIFVRYLTGPLAGTTVLVSVNSDEEQADAWSDAASINADGTIVAFASGATNLMEDDSTPGDAPDVFVRDLVAGTTDAGERQWRRGPGQRLELRSLDQRRRLDRGLRIGRDQPRGRGC